VDDTQRLRYSRHLLLSGWSEAAQQRLMAAHALVVGVGGLGAPAAMYLAAAGVGHLTLVDPDQVELSNLQRQIAHVTDRIGQSKAQSAQQTLHALNPEVQVHAQIARVDEPWLSDWLTHWQQQHPHAALVVLDCTDQFAARHAINRACWQAGVPVVSASAVQWDAQITAFDPRVAHSPCYACLFPQTQALPDAPCATLGVFAPLVGMAGVMQAGEALKQLAQLERESESNGPEHTGAHTSLVGRLCLVDARTWQITTMKVPPRADCPVCSRGAQAMPSNDPH
jgi:molybdopterin/thiamine biosynthesis adenylyltransferase